jgi:hypothetical protein
MHTGDAAEKTEHNFEEVEILNPATVTISPPEGETNQSLDTEENNIDFGSSEGGWEQKSAKQKRSLVTKKIFNPNNEPSLASSIITHDAE